MEAVRKPGAAPESAPDGEAAPADGDAAAADDGAADAAAASDDAATSEAATTTSPAKSSLNPNAKPFVPAPAAPPAEKPTKKSGDDDEEDDGEDDDADEDKAAVAEETTGGEEEMEEVTRWSERGVGQLRILVHKPLAPGSTDPLPHPRLVMRVEHVGRLILNEVLLPSTAPAQRVSDTSIRLVVVSAASGPQSYLFRVKTPVEAEQLIAQVNATIPTAPK